MKKRIAYVVSWTFTDEVGTHKAQVMRFTQTDAMNIAKCALGEGKSEVTIRLSYHK